MEKLLALYSNVGVRCPSNQKGKNHYPNDCNRWYSSAIYISKEGYADDDF